MLGGKWGIRFLERKCFSQKRFHVAADHVIPGDADHVIQGVELTFHIEHWMWQILPVALTNTVVGRQQPE